MALLAPAASLAVARSGNARRFGLTAGKVARVAFVVDHAWEAAVHERTRRPTLKTPTTPVGHPHALRSSAPKVDARLAHRPAELLDDAKLA